MGIRAEDALLQAKAYTRRLFAGGGSGGGSTPTLADLGVNATAKELNYMAGVTYDVQKQLDTKAKKLEFQEFAPSVNIGGVMGASGSVNVHAMKLSDNLLVAHMVITTDFSMNSYVSSGNMNVSIRLYDPDNINNWFAPINGVILMTNPDTSEAVSDIKLVTNGTDSINVQYAVSTKYSVTVDILCLLFMGTA